MHRATVESPRYRQLSCYARAAYVEIGVLFFGSNNGGIQISTRQIADRLGVSKSQGIRAMAELVESGLVEVTQAASFGVKPVCATYRLVDRKCNVTGLRAGETLNQANVIHLKPRNKNTA
jgi:DNA-binding transcriptional MocR family regulator